MTFAAIFPGQGSQSTSMLADLAAEFEIVEQTFAEASDSLGFDLWKLTQENPDNALNKTLNTQPAMLAAGVAAWRVWCAVEGAKPAVMAGHSLGEYTALVASGALGFADAVRLVEARARYMQQAVPEGEGAMAAILGLQDEQIIAVCQSISQPEDIVEAVNFNAPGQVVIAGSAEAVELALVAAKAEGAKRALMLPVSVPSHSSLMRPASEKLAESLDFIDIKAPNIPVIHNATASVCDSAEAIREALIQQLYSPVRWVESVQAMQGMNASGLYIEMGPGKVLSGLVKRTIKRTPVACVDSPSGLDNALDMQP
jgi:[acyl-carrier-protein] S-malonyltransferase